MEWTQVPRVREGKAAWWAKTEKGSAIIHDFGDYVIIDIWGPGQVTIGMGKFPTVDAAKRRAEAVLDPRTNAWDVVGNLLDDD